MSKFYFIDSENVGDQWIHLLENTANEDELLVFYTPKSPHMNYKNLVLLKQSPREVTFIECCEGNNALDFQLSTDLGYRICMKPDQEYVIVSNDNGYEAVVKYWKQRHIAIRRIQARACAFECKSIPSPKKPLPIVAEKSNIETAVSDPARSEVRTETAAAAIPAETISEIKPAEVIPDTKPSEVIPDAKPAEVIPDAKPAEVIPDAKPAEVIPDAKPAEVIPDAKPAEVISNTKPAEVIPELSLLPALAPETSPLVIDDTAKEILYIIGKENLQILHEALQQLYGAQKSKLYYNAFKSDSSYKSFIAQHNKLSLEEKLNLYCTIVFEVSDTKAAMPSDFPKFAIDSWRKKKNLNSFRASLMSRYGKDKCNIYYALIKAHVKILDQIK